MRFILIIILSLCFIFDIYAFDENQDDSVTPYTETNVTPYKSDNVTPVNVNPDYSRQNLPTWNLSAEDKVKNATSPNVSQPMFMYSPDSHYYDYRYKNYYLQPGYIGPNINKRQR